MSNGAWFVRWDFEKWAAHTRHLSPLAYGAYMKILAHAWIHSADHCSVSANNLALQQITGVYGEDFSSVWNEIMSSPERADITLLLKRRNRWYNKGLQKEWKHIQDTRKAKQQAAEARWKPDAGALQVHSACNAKREEKSKNKTTDKGRLPPKLLEYLAKHLGTMDAGALKVVAGVRAKGSLSDYELVEMAAGCKGRGVDNPVGLFLSKFKEVKG